MYAAARQFLLGAVWKVLGASGGLKPLAHGLHADNMSDRIAHCDRNGCQAADEQRWHSEGNEKHI